MCTSSAKTRRPRPSGMLRCSAQRSGGTPSHVVRRRFFVELGGMTILIRGKRPGEAPTKKPPIRPFADFSSHDEWGTDHFGFMYEGDLTAFCDELRTKGITFPV